MLIGGIFLLAACLSFNPMNSGSLLKESIGVEALDEQIQAAIESGYLARSITTKTLESIEEEEFIGIEEPIEVIYSDDSLRADDPDGLIEDYSIESNGEYVIDQSYQFMGDNEKTSEEYLLDAILSDCAPMGNIGRFYIPDAGISVAANELHDWWSWEAQDVVDRADSMGIYFDWDGWYTLLADHSNQAFRTLSSCRVGSKAYLKWNDGSITTWECTLVTTGHNDGYEIYTDNWVPVPQSGYDMCAYTCNGCWQNIHLIFFNKV